jgi:hypothetical protein
VCDFLFDLVLDAETADGAECVELDFSFFELFEVGVAGGMEFRFGILGAIGGEGADAFAYMAGTDAGFRVSF